MGLNVLKYIKMHIPQKGKKMDKNGKKLRNIFTRCLVPEIQIFGHFWLKSAFLGPNFSRTEICTAKPMVVSCVQHYSTHFVNKLGKSLEYVFSCKVQKTVSQEPNIV